MDIYVNTKKKVHLKKHIAVRVKDVADIEAPAGAKAKIDEITLLKGGTEGHAVIEFNQIVKAVLAQYPNATLINTGEKSVLLEYASEREESRLFGYLKIAFVCVIIFAGSATAIMSFHSDSQIVKVLEKYSELFMGDKDKAYIIEIAYSLGLAAGIIVFFNHFGKRRLTNDPTPIQVEISLYENDVTQTMVETISRKKSRMQRKE